MSDNLNEKQSAMDKEEVQKIIDERIARFVEKEKKADISSTNSKLSLRKNRLCKMIRWWKKSKVEKPVWYQAPYIYFCS